VRGDLLKTATYFNCISELKRYSGDESSGGRGKIGAKKGGRGSSCIMYFKVFGSYL